MESLVTGFRTGPMIPLFLEAAGMALTGFSVGLLLAYLVALRRRSTRYRRF